MYFYWLATIPVSSRQNYQHTLEAIPSRNTFPKFSGLAGCVVYLHFVAHTRPLAKPCPSITIA